VTQRGPDRRPLLRPADVEDLRGVGQVRSLPAGTRVCTAGQRPSHVVVVTAGEVELLAGLPQGGRAVMHVVRRGGVVADIPLLLSAPMPFDAVTSRPSELVRLDRRAWVGLLGRSPALSLRWMRSIALRLDADRRRLAVVTTRPLESQVAYLLREHAEVDEDGAVVVRLTHEVLAQLLGARRQSVSRVLGRLHARGLTEARYGATRVLDPPALALLAGPEPFP